MTLEWFNRPTLDKVSTVMVEDVTKTPIYYSILIDRLYRKDYIAVSIIKVKLKR